jgi:membrane-associated phospholipid phosphatase
MVAYARVKKGAHRIVQVIAGYIFGLALAYGIYRLQ